MLETLTHQHIILPQNLDTCKRVQRESFKVRKFCKFDPYFTLITITFLKVLFVDYVLVRIESMKLLHRIARSANFLGFFAPKMTLISPLKFLIPPHTGFIFFDPPLSEPKK